MSWSLPRSFVVVALAALLLTGCSALRPPAAVIDGREIDDAELERQVRVFSFFGELTNQQCGQAFPGESAEAACARFTLANMVQGELMAGYAEEHGLSVAEERVERQLDEIDQDLGAGAIDELLARRGLTRDDLHDLIRLFFLSGLVQRAVAEERLTDAALEASYAERSAEFTVVQAAHILVKTRREAVLIASDGLTAENFARSAKHFSIDRATARNGGDLQPAAAANFVSAFRDAVLELEPGEISEPVQSEFGWHLILVKSKEITPLEELRDRLIDDLAAGLFDEWVLERLATADIEVNPRYGRLDTETGFVVPIRSTSTTPADFEPVVPELP